jgi:hypothetical protein
MAAFPDMLRRDRERWGLREAEAALRFDVSVREYRELLGGTRPQGASSSRIER